MPFDKRMWAADILGSQEYAAALARCGIIGNDERDALIAGLDAVHAEWAAGKFDIKSSDEDIHTANERRLSELIGSVAGKLHTGRSRNDQVATDVRLWLRSELRELGGLLLALIRTASDRAGADIDHIMPGYTHLQAGLGVAST
jgi:argininosuccinate lyase